MLFNKNLSWVLKNIKIHVNISALLKRVDMYQLHFEWVSKTWMENCWTG
jgi:hypothetical protein